MHKEILATLENYNGLPEDMVKRLESMPFANDHVFEVKKIELANKALEIKRRREEIW